MLGRVSILVVTLCALAVPGIPAAALEADDNSLEIVYKFLDASKIQDEALRGKRMQVAIDAELPKLKKQGKGHAFRTISKLGEIIYRQFVFSGDNTVKQEVIARYLAAETEERDKKAMAITPANYKFRFKGTIETNGQKTHVIAITPKRKSDGLFKGELWLDSVTGMPVKEFGELVKSPNRVFLKKVEILREYEVRGGVSFPTRFVYKAQTRGFGPAEMNIEYSDYQPDEEVDTWTLVSDAN